MRRCQTIVLLAVLALPSLVYAQASSAAATTLQVTGPAGQSIELGARELDAMPRETANVVDEKGNQASYEGVPVIEILRRVGAPIGHDMRGKQMTLYLLVGASDGYHAVFAIAELDPGFLDRHVIVADRRDGKALSSNEGPFRIIAPQEKRHARWVRNVTSLTVKSAE
jgi:hypothetical protein